jgi:hypothetical protein
MNKNYVDKNTGIIYYKLSQPCDAKFLIVAAEGGKVVEINHFGSFRDAKPRQRASRLRENNSGHATYNLYKFLKEELKNGSSDLVTRQSGQVIRECMKWQR